MKIFFDARYIRTDFHDGISRYTTELGNALAALTPITFIISDQAQLAFLPANTSYVKIHTPTSPREPLTAIRLNTFRPDVVISPLQSMGSIGRRFKLILNQQDMTYYKLPTPPRQFPWYVRAAWRLYHTNYWPGRLTLNGADIVVTVSETSKREIIDAHLTKRPVIVVPNAAEDLGRFLQKPVIQKKSPPKNLVYMGAFLPHKNVETLIRMMDFLPDKTLHLLSGITPRRKKELMKIASQGAKIIFHGGVSDEKYAQILADDAIMVSASKAEGFGLPLIEALRLGVPTVVSDIPIFHEVGNGGALYANPNDPEDFATHVSRLNDFTVRSRLVKSSKVQSERFSWNNSAHTLLAAARKLLN
jgi:glycosyltransferase involved in cell wall biosynthesis